MLIIYKTNTIKNRIMEGLWKSQLQIVVPKILLDISSCFNVYELKK